MKIQAIASCRVSTPEQKLSNSLDRQEGSVIKAAAELGAPIVKWWTGDVSSKAGTNVNRKDLKEMQEYCKQHKQVKYLIVDEPDRFMRSIDEAYYFEVTFRLLGVTVWYASDPMLNTGDLMAKLLKFAKYFPAEGSNFERQTKSIRGHEAAIRAGRYTFPPKPGYTKGTEPGVHLPHPGHYNPFQKALKEVASRIYTPSEALKRLNQSDFSRERSPMKIDKFMKFLVDPYYSGYLEINHQVKAKCETGLHQAMITKEEHESILVVVSGRPTRSLSKKQYNPDFPLSKLLRHDCESEAKFTGAFQGNGRGGRYPKYRCRKCGKQYRRDSVHEALNETLGSVDYDGSQRSQFISSLATVWQQKQYDSIQQVKSLQKRLERLENAKSGLVRELSSADSSLKEDIKKEIQDIRSQISNIQDDIFKISNLREDLVEFVKFGLEYTNILKEDWWLLNQEDRLLCQQLLFPAQIKFDSSSKVSTTQISPLYRLAASKKTIEIDRKSLLVELRGFAPRSAGSQSSHLQV